MRQAGEHLAELDFYVKQLLVVTFGLEPLVPCGEALVNILGTHHSPLAEDLRAEMPDDVRVPQLLQQGGLPQEGRGYAVVLAGIGELKVHHAQQHRLAGTEAPALEESALGTA